MILKRKQLIFRCLWNKTWHPYSTIPNCVVTHCAVPPHLPTEYNLLEDSQEWTPVRNTKNYTCKGKYYINMYGIEKDS